MNPTSQSSLLIRRTALRISPMRAILTCAVLFGTAALASADVRLRGNVGPRTIDDDVVIVRGTSCTLNGTIIKGNIRIQSGARLITNGARITGNVRADVAFLVDLRRATRVNGDVQGEDTRSILIREGTRVGGNVQLKYASAPSGVDALFVKNAIITGDLQTKICFGRLRVVANRIGGNLQFVENQNGPYAMTNNVVRGDLQFFKNQGSGTITGNQVGGNLQSKENSPAPLVRNNRVEGETELE